jgi:oligopeptide/dipeptide ABC transporter ATP-binding protein
MKKIRRDMQIIFQDPYSSLDPRKSIGEIIMRPMVVHGVGNNRRERFERVTHLMEKVGLDPRWYHRYPHELDGGRRQRVGIARALALNPTYIVCDEPVSALDVSVQAQVINLMQDLQEEYHLTYLFISHDLSVVKHVSNRIAVMYLGEIVELAASDELFQNPQHPYTKALLSAVPVPSLDNRRERVILQGDVPSPKNPPSGCRFHTRCPFAVENCRTEAPRLQETEQDHHVACHLIAK